MKIQISLNGHVALNMEPHEILHAMAYAKRDRLMLPRPGMMCRVELLGEFGKPIATAQYNVTEVIE